MGAWICPITRHNFARILTHDKTMPTIKGDEIAPAEIDRRAGMPVQIKVGKYAPNSGGRARSRRRSQITSTDSGSLTHTPPAKEPAARSTSGSGRVEKRHGRSTLRTLSFRLLTALANDPIGNLHRPLDILVADWRGLRAHRPDLVRPL